MLFEAQRKEVRSLRTHYRTGRDDLSRDFFQIALAHCMLYQRAAGYFSSSAFVSWGQLLRRLPIELGVRVQLIVSPELSPEDAAVLRRAVVGDDDVLAIEALLERFLINSFLSDAALRDPVARATLLEWLIKNRRLELRFGLPSHTSGAGLYHEKIGLLEFPWGDRLAFTGSANETLSGHSLNLESIDVYRSWDARDTERVETKAEQFREAWEGRLPGLRCVALSAESLERIRERVESAKAYGEPSGPYGAGSTRARSLRPFQEDAVRAWEDAGWKGTLAMCTGSGKTIAAIEGLDRFRMAGVQVRGLAVIVACPTRVLVDQWERALREWSPEATIMKAYESVDNYAQHLPDLLCPGAPSDFNVVITTYDSLFSRALLSQLKRAHHLGHRLAFVADEAHRLATGDRLKNLVC